MRRFAFVLALTCVVSVGARQTARTDLPTGKGSIRGQVVDATSGAPVAGATVTVGIRYTSVSRSVQADAAGEFVVEHVPAGTLTVSARKDQSYSGGRYGQRSPDSMEQPFDLADGEHATGVELRLWRNAIVSGRVTDATGRGIPGVAVRSLRLGIVDGVRHLRAGVQGRTDAAGRYRIERIWPGTYGVAVVSTVADGYEQGGGASQAYAGYPTTFHPAAASPDAATLMNLIAGEEREGVDFTLTTSSLVSVAGTIEGLPAGARSPVVELRPAGHSDLETDIVIAGAVATSDGRFRFPRVRPGSYLLRTVVFPSAERVPGTRAATQTVSPGGMTMVFGSSDPSLPLAPLPAAPTLWGELPVTIPNGDVIGFTMTLRPAGRIRGRIEFEGTSPRPPAELLSRTAVAIMGVEGPRMGSLPVGRIEETGEFSTAGLPPGRYNLAVMAHGLIRMTGGWYSAWRQESVSAGGRAVGSVEVLDADVTGVIVRFSDSPGTELSGLVRDAAGRLQSDATIYVFPADRRHWVGGSLGPLREVRPGRTGRYTVSGLPPGEYLVAAVLDEATELWRDPAFLEKLSASAVRTTLTVSERKVVDVAVR
jgi:protocatechuate 3,4-dioxygenase beta subunit